MGMGLTTVLESALLCLTYYGKDTDMGADFTYAAANITRPQAEWVVEIHRLDSVDDIVRFLAPTGMDWLFDHFESIDELKATLMEDIDIAYGYSRETSRFHHKDETFVITGGMSWGDNPTDVYDSIERFDAIQDYVNNKIPTTS